MKQSLSQSKTLLALTLLLSITTSAATVFIALILQKVIDAAMQGDRELFRQILILSVIYLLLLAVLGFVYSLCSKALIRNLTVSLREMVFRGIFQRKVEEFTSANTADYLSALTNDIKLAEDNYIHPMLLTLQNTVIFAVSLIVLFYVSPLVTLILILSMVLMFAVPSLFGKALQNRQNAVSAQMSVFTARLKDLLSGYEVIKSYAIGRHAARKFKQKNEMAANTRFAADRLFAANEGISQTLAVLSQFAVVFIAAWLIISGDLSAGSLVALVQLSGGIVGPVLIIMENLPKIQGVKPVLDRIDALAGSAEDRQETHTAILDPVFNDSLEVRQLQFAYPSGKPVLKGIDLTLRKGKKYALVGQSGCGKSTLVKLLSGYYERYEGTIAVDGTDTRRLDGDKLLQMASTIHQNVYMFDNDIRQNITLDEDYTEEELERAVRMSGMHKFITAAPQGLLSPVGENGSRLSGGQRQRIAVARALIRNKPLLILDEGTSAIDMQTAYEIESRLLKHEGLTLITITHNMNEDLLSLYDEIIYMENGEIAGIGSLEELLEASSGFRSFYTLNKEESAGA
ncbi:ABC transporter ATP-binding protein [Paenibacillus sp. PK3_47]|uniref:ABC transporter ATP-binding protein n=1 Tax=Paenibacillus sp. PK3_47 TaxID=2072642 RepID=UPI00201E5EA5|nr:ABC transporter ATP-binding protein [Paenibacillus sp. PK3_47]UQZ36708.1 ABC transporter ATP-binding protein [Paenibacillus sp. PK3_47]